MKKSSKILGSIALSAALIMGTAAPAFADVWPDQTKGSDMVTDDDGQVILNSPQAKTTKGAATIVDENSDNKDAQGSSTVVTVSTYTSQVNVTVPLYLPIWLDTAGGAPVVPSNYKYYIANNSPVAIDIDTAQYKVYNEAKLKFESHTKTLGQNQFWISLTPETTSFDTLYLEDTAANTGTYEQDLNWSLAKGVQLGLGVGAKSGTIDHGISDAKLASIIYTVKVNNDTKKPWDGKNETVDDGDEGTAFDLTTGDNAIATSEARSAIFNHIQAETGRACDTDNTVVYVGTAAPGVKLGTDAIDVKVPGASSITSVTLAKEDGTALTTKEAVKAYTGEMIVTILVATA